MADTSKTVHQAIVTLESLRNQGPGSVTEIARRTGMSRTVVGRLIATMEDHGLVRRTADGIDLGYGLLDLAAGLAGTLRETARPFLQSLALRFDETAVLAVIDGADAVAVDQIVPDGRVVRVHYGPGTRHSLADAAHGRAILAFADPETQQRVLRRGAAVTADDLEETRRRGCAVSHDELESGVAGLAAPVLGSDGYAVASIGVVAPALRFPAEAHLARDVMGAAERITLTMDERPTRRVHAIEATA